MSVQPVPEPRCAVCGAIVTVGAARCPACGLSHPDATGSRVLARRGVWALGALLFVVWVTALAVVATAR
jgi:transposase